MKKRISGLSAKLIASVLLLSVLLCVAISSMGYRQFTTVLEAEYNRSAYEIAETARTYLNADRLLEYLETGRTDAEYEAVQQKLDALVLSTNTYLIYVTSLSKDYTTSTYIFDAVHPDTGFSRYELGYTAQDMDPAYQREVARIMTTGERSAVYFYSYTEASGAHTTAAIPVQDSSGQVVAFLGVEKAMTELDNARSTYVRNVMGITVLAVILFLTLYIGFLRRQVVSPILTITRETQRFAQDNVARVEVLDGIRKRDEIGVLAKAIGTMETDIVRYVQNLTAVTAEKERIGAELHVATQIQADMLPSIFPAFPERPEFDIYAGMVPAREVGGDFYDYFLVDNDHLALVIADVSGKGVPAALFMVIAKTLLKNAAQTGLSPKVVLEKVNNQLCENNQAEMFVTVWLGIYEISTGRLTAANAGHEYPALCRKGGRFSLLKDRHGFVLAGMEEARYREYELTLAPGDILFLYTDGVAEATDSANELYGTDRMLEALNSVPGAAPQRLLETVKDSVDRFVGDSPQFDDITMLAFQRKDPGAGKSMRVVPALDRLPEVCAFLEQTLLENGAPPKAVAQVNIAADELFSNIARYSGAADAAVDCRVTANRAVIRFLDDGRPYDPTTQPEPDVSLSAEEREIGGLGIFMVKKTMDRVSYEYANGHNVLTIEKRW